jgi:hypothetical protein
MINYVSYMDETGHSDDPALHFAGMAGFVAPAGAWEVFEDQWRDTMRNAGLSEPFHMKEFAHSEGQFKTWKGKKEKRELLFGRLLNIIAETKAEPIGTVVSINDFKTLTTSQQESFLDPYYIAFQKCTRGAAASAVFDPPEEKVAMVYAYNEEFGTKESSGVNIGGRAEQLWHAMKKQVTDIGPRMGTYASASPIDVLPLQAADLFAYELSKEFENRIKRPEDRMRYGLRQIVKMVGFPLPRISLMDRMELLRSIKEAQFEDQTGIEELADYEMRGAMQRMIRWMYDRGEFSDDDVRLA